MRCSYMAMLNRNTAFLWQKDSGHGCSGNESSFWLWDNNVVSSTLSQKRLKINPASLPSECTAASASDYLGSEWLGLKVWEEGDVTQALLKTWSWSLEHSMP